MQAYPNVSFLYPEMKLWSMVSNDKDYFAKNHPELKVNSANIDDFILLLGGNEA